MSLYRENILDHYKNPRNYGVISDADFKAHLENPLCGDVVDIFIKTNGARIADIKFSGIGCAISKAATSMLTEKLKGASVEEAKNITEQDVLQMLNVPISSTRLKCALLGWLCLGQMLVDF